MSPLRDSVFFVCAVLSCCTSASAQQKILWEGAVKPEAINAYESTSTRERVTATLKQGDVVDVVLQISTTGDAWCRVSLAGTSEPLGYVLCFNLERGRPAAIKNASTQATAPQSHPSTIVAAPSPTSVTTTATSGGTLGSAALTNNDILDMHRAGLPQNVLVAKIKSSQCNFDTAPAQLKQLKAEGLADAVILAMVEVPGAHVPSSDPSPASSAGAEADALEAEHSHPSGSALHHKMVLENNTPVHLILSENLSSASATTGQTISFEVSEDILVDGFLVIPRGSLAWGTVTDAQAKRRLGRAGHLDVNIDKVRLADGEKVLLNATSHAKGGSHTAAMTAGIVATSLVVWPAAPFFLFMHGHDITIPKGTKIEAFTNGDATLDPAKFEPAPK